MCGKETFLGSALASSRWFNKEILFKYIKSAEWSKKLKKYQRRSFFVFIELIFYDVVAPKTGPGLEERFLFQEASVLCIG